jgi:hypothetical protein
MKPDAICIFIGPSISRRSPVCSALFFKLIFKNNKFIYLYYHAQTLLTRTSEMSLILNFLTEISIIEGNPQTLPQISHHLSQSARLIIICRLGTCVRSRISLHRFVWNAVGQTVDGISLWLFLQLNTLPPGSRFHHIYSSRVKGVSYDWWSDCNPWVFKMTICTNSERVIRTSMQGTRTAKS